MNIGQLNKRITIQKYTTTENNLGDSISEWTDYKSLWASVTNLHGREFWQAQQVKAENTIKFTIRYCKDLDTTMRIRFGKRTINILDSEGNIVETKEVDNLYDIKFIDNIKYNNTFMEIQGLAVI